MPTTIAAADGRTTIPQSSGRYLSTDLLLQSQRACCSDRLQTAALVLMSCRNSGMIDEHAAGAIGGANINVGSVVVPVRDQSKYVHIWHICIIHNTMVLLSRCALPRSIVVCRSGNPSQVESTRIIQWIDISICFFLEDEQLGFVGMKYPCLSVLR